MEINIRYFYPLRDMTGIAEEKIRLNSGTTMELLLESLSRKYGEDFEKYIYSGVKRKGLKIIFLLNGTNILQLQGLKTKLVNGSTVTMMPPVAGGCH